MPALLNRYYSKELRMTGYRGCLSKQNVPITNTLKQATLTYNFTTTLRGATINNGLPAD